MKLAEAVPAVHVAPVPSVRERPILFKGEMVRAILEGRKTQTRRVIKPVQPRADGRWPAGRDPLPDCPHGVPGDRLWVRETWEPYPGGKVVFRADMMFGVKTAPLIRWRPSIFMPRAACRLMLEVTDVRVQRVQDISEADAKAEGLKGITKDGHTVKYGIPDRDGFPGTDDDGWEWQNWNTDPRLAFRRLWDSINKPRGFGWDENPWVWCISFKPAEVQS